MKKITLSLAIALLATTAGAANAASSIGLSTNYKVSFTNLIPDVAEASGVTYNWDRKTLLVVGDEGVSAEYNLDGSKHLDGVDFPNYLGSQSFADPEGLTYIGGGRYVFAEERTTRMWAVNHVGTAVAGGSTYNSFGPKDAAYSYSVSGGSNWGNQGLEGISYDPLTDGYFGVKETGPQGVFFINWDANTADSAGTTTSLFDPALLGLNTISDIKTFSTVGAFEGTDFAGNLLILSQSSQKLLEVTRSGEILSTFDLSGILSSTGYAFSTIEGVTFDDDGNIYLVAEEGGRNMFNQIVPGMIKLERMVATPAVPEPATWAMMIGGFALVGASMRRRKATVRFA